MTELKEVGLLEDYEEYRHLESQKNENGVNQTKVFFSIFVIEWSRDAKDGLWSFKPSFFALFWP